ncbi:MAG: pyridoxal phosphate-dependent aminotransferase [Erysipelotrichaceae bacterium]|nr:pyridoxal phosphate-dependent aminotransferase [Erysipelotrichaceae bacterium]
MIVEKMKGFGTTRSCIRELFEYGLKQAAIVGKENVFDFSLGNPSVPTPEGVANVIRDLLEMDTLTLHGYTPAAGAANTRMAIAGDLSRRSGDDIRPENIFVTCGAAPGITATMNALAEEGDEIMLLAPYFPEYPAYASLTGAKLVIVPADTEHFQLKIDEVEKRITPHTQIIIVNSPNNPSGVIYSVETLTALAEVMIRKSQEYGHPIYIISDEPYRELVYDGEDTPYLPAIYPNTVICYSYSKSLSMPGERIGYVCVPDCCENSKDLFAAIAGAARAIGHVCAPSLLQQVIARCTDLRPDLSAYDLNRTTLYNELTAIGYHCIKPKGAFYMLVEAPDGNSLAFSERAKAHNVLIVPTDDFGCPGFVRISTCVSHDMLVRSIPLFRTIWEEYQQ